MFKKKQKKPKEREKFRFVFPNIMAKMMKDVPMRAQLEGSMLSMFLIMISLTLMAIYFLFFMEGSWVYKVLLVINFICGLLFLSSFLVTTYQQYITHMEAMGFDPRKEREEVKKRGHLFKRIKLALDERKKVKMKEKENQKPLFQDFVNEAMKSMEKINEDKEKTMEGLKKDAQKLQQASERLDEKFMKDTNRNKKEVNK